MSVVTSQRLLGGKDSECGKRMQDVSINLDLASFGKFGKVVWSRHASRAV